MANLPIVHINGKAVNFDKALLLEKGTTHLVFCQLCYGVVEPETLVETDGILKLDSGLFANVQWTLFTLPAVTLAYPWHEKAGDILSGIPEVNQLLSAADADTIALALKSRFIPVNVLEPNSFHKVVIQQCCLPNGGFIHISIQKRQPRKRLGLEYKTPFAGRQVLLHDGGDACMVLPQRDMDVHFILDFGKEYIGYIELQLDAPEGTILDVQCFELIDGNGISWMPVHNGFRYICKDGYQTFISHYRRGFRNMSVTVRNFKRPVALYNIRLLHTAYPVEEVGSFECSDELLNKVFRMSLDTAALCMLDSYVDCPGHEQSFWVGDARITALINLMNFGAADLNQSFLRIVGQSLSDEWIKTYWPSDPRYLERCYLPIAAFPNYPEGCLPMWIFQWVLQIWDWTRSIAHAWAAAQARYLPSEVLGVKPVEPGYRKFTIDPKPGDLAWARGSVSTPYGPIQVSWDRKPEGKMDIRWLAPEECVKV
jgi:hypothetical protein